MRSLEEHQCPRCGGGIPTEAMRGRYPGAISRVDNVTEVCSRCGYEEAMREFAVGLRPTKDGWWVNRDA